MRERLEAVEVCRAALILIRIVPYGRKINYAKASLQLLLCNRMFEEVSPHSPL